MNDTKDSAARENGHWLGRLSADGAVREAAIAELHELMLRAARYQVRRIPGAEALGETRRDEVVHSAADQATMAVLGKLETFEGRSKFTTWAFKFALLHAGTELRRAAWRGQEIDIEDIPEPAMPTASSPESLAEGNDVAAAVRHAIEHELTPHQRRVAVALLIEEIPVDVLAERMDTNRNALYKTLHDVRKRLRSQLEGDGFFVGTSTEEMRR